MSKILTEAEELLQACMKENIKQAEVTINKSKVGMARFKDKAIHQNIEGFRPLGPPYNTFSVKLRIINENDQLGITKASYKDNDILVQETITSAKFGPEYKSFTSPVKIPSLSDLYYSDTANLDPLERIESVNSIVDYCRDTSDCIKSVGGLLSNMVSDTVIVNSLGLEAEHKYTGSQIIVTAVARINGNEGSGYQRQDSRDFHNLDIENVSREAARSAISTIGYRKQVVPIGKRSVIFEAEAAAEYIGTLTQQAFSTNRARRTTERVPLGELVFNENLTITDNGRDRRTLQASAFDGEGIPKRNICLINNGVPENRCFDTTMAMSEGTNTTGHASTPWSGYFWTGTGNGSTYTPTNQIIEPKNSDLDEMISDTKDGVLVRRLRCPAARGQTIMPDIIRADTQECWTIKNGDIIGPANYIRFTDSLVNTLKDIQIGDYSTMRSVGSFFIPAIKVNYLYISQPSVIMYQ